MTKPVAATASPTRTLLRPSVEALFVFGSGGGVDVFTGAAKSNIGHATLQLFREHGNKARNEKGKK